MSFFGFFGKIAHAFASPPATQFATSLGSALVGTLNPGLGTLVEMVGNAAYAVEMKSASAPGQEKKDQVKQILDVTSPVTLQLLAAVTGRAISDPSALAPVLDRLIDDIVALFNTLGVFQKPSDPLTLAAPAPAPAQ